MTTNHFLEAIAAQPEKELVFEYVPGKTVGANYHITEIKNVSLDTVDCGGRADTWKETVIQLWENPSEARKTHFMKATKALGILRKVNRIRPMEANAEIKIEYGNPSFHTAQLAVEKVFDDGEYLLVQLFSQETSCKASAICGVESSTPKAEEECCVPGNCCSK
jgi:hypothetical protein